VNAKALAIDLKVFGAEHPDTITTQKCVLEVKECWNIGLADSESPQRRSGLKTRIQTAD
jgi:hypothetical protein